MSLGDISLLEWALGRAAITDVVGIALCFAVLVRRASTGAFESNAMARRLATIGLLAMTIVLIGVVGWHFGKNALPEALREPHMISLLRATLHPGSKTPPSPAYLLFYGGAGLLMTAMFFYNRPRWLLDGIAAKAATIGKVSLLCFIVQDWLLFLIPQILGFERVTSVPFWLSYFTLCVIALYCLSSLWIRIDGNWFFTVGFKRLRKYSGR